MKVTVFGIGYVGLVQAAVLAEVGHEVLCIDVDAKKVENLKNGQIPIFEPGLTPLVQQNYEAGRLLFSTNAAEGVAHATVQFIAVGTPPDEDGSADLKYVTAVARTIAEHMTEPKVVIDKSTVPVGTADKVRAVMTEKLKNAVLISILTWCPTLNSSKKARQWLTVCDLSVSLLARIIRMPLTLSASCTSRSTAITIV